MVKVEEEKIKRLKDSVKYLISKGLIDGRAPITSIAKTMNRDRHNISSVMNGNEKYFTMKFMIDFCTTFGNYISPEWIFEGTGEMIDPNSFKPTMKVLPSDDMPIKTYDVHVGVPYYNVDFELGFDMMVNDQTNKPSYMIDFEPYNKCTCWCNARGNSMHPTISSGDVIAMREIRDFHSLISGEIYAIVTINDLRTIKRVKDNGKTLTLIPDNKDYPKQTIDKKEVRAVYQVMGSMKMF